jgi:hypothetical protein
VQREECRGLRVFGGEAIEHLVDGEDLVGRLINRVGRSPCQVDAGASTATILPPARPRRFHEVPAAKVSDGMAANLLPR